MTTELSMSNGWIPEPSDSEVLTKVLNTSAVESAARKVRMTSETVSVPRFDAQGVDVVAEHAVIPVLDATLDEVVLTAKKFANRFAVSIEDTRDGIADSINQFKLAWASNFAVKLDNACLGASGAANGGTRPFTSVYQAATTNKIATAGSLTYEDLVSAVGELEDGDYGDDLVVIAHPAFRMELRNLKDASGARVVATEGVLGAGVPTVFGYELKFSKGARVNTTASDRPTGSPLLIVGSKRNLILGQRDGVESALSNEARWETDEVELKMRARRGFAVADATAFRVIEKTAAP
jgi:HK97 family phage major capsid protein